jgi:vacuolar-type H+-ATPase subunit E/Vma4
MQTFSELRQAARERRDKLIDKARSEYEDTLRQIANLEQDLLGREPSTHRSMSSCVSSVIPNDGPFTSGILQTAW